MPPKDYYATLSVDRAASSEEIRRAYRKLAMKHHPDRNQGDAQAAERFKAISEAYEVLGDDAKREQYDRYGTVGDFGSGQGPDMSSVFRDIFGGGGGRSGFGDIFEEIFSGGGGGRGGSRRGAPRSEDGEDIGETLEIDLADVCTGVRRELRYNTMAGCTACDSSGFAPGSEPQTCPQCGGKGVLSGRRGPMMVQTYCARCNGSGEYREPCAECDGNARKHLRRSVDIDIPKGIEDGQQVRAAGMGCEGVRGGRPGDLYVQVRIRPDPMFERQGSDLLCELPISLRQAMLGDEVELPYVGGKVSLKVPEGVQDGARLRLKGKGVPHLRGPGAGDMICRVKVHLPRELTKSQRAAFEKFDQTLSDTQREGRGGLEGWIDRLGRFVRRAAENLAEDERDGQDEKGGGAGQAADGRDAGAAEEASPKGGKAGKGGTRKKRRAGG